MALKSKLSRLGLLALTTVVTLAACGKGSDGGSGSDGKQTAGKDSGGEDTELLREFKATYISDPTTLDYTFSQRDLNYTHAVNFVDGLYETNNLGEYVPAVAESHEVSEDGLTYTYHLKKGVMWSDVDGNEIDEVKAQDFVTGLKHAVESESEMLPIVRYSIEGLDDYIAGKTDDFDKVGVKALDDYTVEYKLARPEPYWNSKTAYGILYPINEEFLNSKGDDFGQLSPDSILYNGPFRLSNLTAKSSIEYVKNDNYWDADNVFLDTVQYTYNDESDLEAFFRMFQDGSITQFAVLPNLPIYDEVKKAYSDNIIVTPPQSGTFMIHFNYNRRSFNATKKENDKQKEDAHKAIMNKKFRQAFKYGFDKVAYMSQLQGDEYAEPKVRNSFVPTDFVHVGDKLFGNAEEEELKAMDADLYKDVDMSDGHDEFYNPDKAKELFEEAKKELEKEGVDFPIRIDLPIMEQTEVAVNYGKSLKKTVEDSLGADNIQIDINLLAQDPYLNATFNATTADAVDYDISIENGWFPDYLDPSTYLDIYNPVDGTNMIVCGLDGENSEKADESKEIREELGLYDYKKLLDEAQEVTDDNDKRFANYAKAEAWLIDNTFIIPMWADGARPRIQKGIPYSGPYAFAGPTAARLKFFKIQEDPVTQEQYQQLKAEWEKAVEEAGSGSEVEAQKSDDKKDDEKADDQKEEKDDKEADDKKDADKDKDAEKDDKDKEDEKK